MLDGTNLNATKLPKQFCPFMVWMWMCKTRKMKQALRASPGGVKEISSEPPWCVALAPVSMAWKSIRKAQACGFEAPTSASHGQSMSMRWHGSTPKSTRLLRAILFIATLMVKASGPVHMSPLRDWHLFYCCHRNLCQKHTARRNRQSDSARRHRLLQLEDALTKHAVRVRARIASHMRSH